MRIAVVVSLLCLLAAGVFAQVVAPSYLLGPEDRITVTVNKHPEFSGEFLVPPDGILDLPGVGLVAVAGKTVAEVTQVIAARLRQRLQVPEVVVALKAPRQQRIYVLGAVKAPGVYDLKPDWRVVEAVAAAGGLTGIPQECTAVLMRASETTPRRFALPRVLTGAADANPALQPGDVVQVEALERLPVFVTGAVKQPGMVEVPAGAGTLEAIAGAGGLLLPTDEVRASVLRGAQALPVDLQATVTTPLQRGDVLRLDPLRSTRVMVAGKVAKPGFYDVKAEEGVAEALTLAGGLVGEAADSVVTLLRGAQKRTMPLATLYGPSASETLPVRPGDMITVETTRSVRVIVTGRVKTPGFCDLKAGEGVLEALALAGGALDDAGLQKVQVLRATGASEVVNLLPALTHGTRDGLMALQPGDVVVVPESARTFAVLGFVGQPGFFSLPRERNLTLLEALSMAKGPDNARSGLTSVAVLRTKGTGEQERLVVDVTKFIKSADAKQNPMVQPGDIIYVPETKRPDWRFIFNMLSTAALVYNAAK